MGPGVRNAIVMSNNAPSIPHLFLRTTRPLETPIGAVEAKWMVGTLTESLFYDTIDANNLRSLSGLVVTLRPAFEPQLTFGLARVVYRPSDGTAETLRQALDVVSYGSVDSRSDSVSAEHPEQILSLFARWLLPAAGAEVYAEWARTELPHSVRDLLVEPNHSQGYTLGLQWARRVSSDGGVVRLQGELTYLEQSATFRKRPVPGYYVSRTVPQGYTQRGQSIGAAIGPGASSQWLAADYVRDGWQLGIQGGGSAGTTMPSIDRRPEEASSAMTSVSSRVCEERRGSGGVM